MSEERYDLPPETGGDFIKILAPHLSVGNRRLEVGEVVPVALVSPGVAAALVANKRAEWQKRAGPDAPAAKPATGG